MYKKRITIENKELYNRYQKIKSRCYNKNHISYKNYGGRGIKMCDKWLGKDGFKNFLNWSIENGFSSNLQIDRIDNDKEYSPNNCRWVDRKTNISNRRNTIKIDGFTLMEISKKMNIKYDTLWNRYNKYREAQIPKKKCLECKKEFYPYRNNQKFCSNTCRWRSNKKRQTYKNIPA